MFEPPSVLLTRIQEKFDASNSRWDLTFRADALDTFRDAALVAASPIATIDHGPRGVFYGYDFRVGDAGPEPIEINTNACGARLNAMLAPAQKACCVEMGALCEGPVALDAIEVRFGAMFRKEWSLQRGSAPLGTIAIVDAAPRSSCCSRRCSGARDSKRSSRPRRSFASTAIRCGGFGPCLHGRPNLTTHQRPTPSAARRRAPRTTPWS
jgi:hypothetical protein